MFELILDILTPIAILVVGLSISCRDNKERKSKIKHKRTMTDEEIFGMPFEMV